MICDTFYEKAITVQYAFCKTKYVRGTGFVKRVNFVAVVTKKIEFAYECISVESYVTLKLATIHKLISFKGFRYQN